MDIASKEKILIVGADGLIGRASMDYLNALGFQVIGTARHREKSKYHIHLDLLQEPLSWRLPEGIKTTIICAGITSLEACRRNPVESKHINVEAIPILVDMLIKEGVFVVYLSTDKVFDGSVPYRLPDDPLSPVTEYGRQKAQAEQKIYKHGNLVSILRLSKVLGPKDKLFSEWRKKLLDNEAIYPFSDMYMSPIPLALVVRVISYIIGRRLSGILQVSGNKDISYFEAAKIGCYLLGVDSSLIKPVKSYGLKPDMEHLSLHTTLNADRLKSEFNLKVSDVDWIIKKMFTEPEAMLKECFSKSTLN